MDRVASFNSPILAQEVAARLAQAGIVASVYSSLDALPGVGSKQGGRHAVMVNRQDRERARAVLATLQHPASDRADPGWEGQAKPDLTKLPQGIEAPCPACGAPLPLQDGPVNCTECGAPADPIEVLVAVHGPEILLDCYPDDSPEFSDDMLRQAAVHCPSCDYTLQGLEPSGLCPECGNPYSKRAILLGQR